MKGKGRIHFSDNTIYTQLYTSPCGELLLGSFDYKLCLCDWLVERHRDVVFRRLQKELNVSFEMGETAVLNAAAEQLDEYFAGERTTFTIPLFFCGSSFQESVWNELLNIPYGTTISYGEMARRLGRPTAVRAVANANGANAISIFAPCHRVIGSDHSLTGYGGGLAAKRFLLELEGKVVSTI